MRVQFLNGAAVISNVLVDQTIYQKAGAELKKKFRPTMGKLANNSTGSDASLAGAERDAAIAKAKRAEATARRHVAVIGEDVKALAAIDKELVAVDVAVEEAENILRAAREIAERRQSAGAAEREAFEGSVIGAVRQEIETERESVEAELAKAIAPFVARIAALTDAQAVTFMSMSGPVQNWLAN